MLEIGMKGSAETVVTIDNTAKAFTSGALEVFATPAMISLMEETCWKMIQPELEEGLGSVGTKVNVSHTAPSAIGKTVVCEATLIEIDGRRLTFEVVCSDENGMVGMGTHERFIINNEKFMAKAEGKK
ncbi:MULTISPECIES: thioesterase family protein [Pseudobutyrivibrio]|jgi:predicted thioesterase|uniref:Thioesterase n=1 Tax=Pseudobutyrivibrio ruminis TaxID=46206 RepID=A0A2G3E9M2_9FIRM|nr:MULTISPECIES: thioesterase family protein [Pseudobutyrivibrio]MBE5903372.1 thioesterase [Pseudobutyrivibrio sp.]PHU34767.1 thioesterase [Pseudobutyrivibrio ruminis]PHU39845.1 thioesterase [Pseudobutyrivibrio ruminis]